MSTFYDISALIKKADASMKSSISSVLYEESSKLLSDFQRNAPVDTGRYKGNWRIKKSRFSPVSTIASFTIYNNTDYAIYMDEGAEKGKAPWFYTEDSPVQTGRLAVINGRVWAGGWNPGHGRTSKGAIDPILYKNQRRQRIIAGKIADAVIGGFR